MLCVTLTYRHGKEDDQWQVVSETNTGSSEEQWRAKYEILEHKHRLLLEQKVQPTPQFLDIYYGDVLLYDDS